MTELRVPDLFRRGARKDEDASIDAAVRAIGHMCRDLGLPDLSDRRVLDVGCGVRFTQAFVNRSIPVGSYTGLDVYAEMIDFLCAKVDDPRFEFRAVDLHNERYNTAGAPLSVDTRLPVDENAFDVVCLFSVFTHLEPRDAEAMLCVLRRYVAPHGRLFLTMYLDEATPGGYGLMDGIGRAAGPAAVGTVETFRDLDPGRPLFWAVYAEDYARELVNRTGWSITYVGRPDPDMQHHFVCAPA